MITRKYRIEKIQQDIQKFKTSLSAEDLYRLVIDVHSALTPGAFGSLLYTEVEAIIFQELKSNLPKY